MRWVVKAALQRALGLLPQGERLNYLFQRHVSRSLPGGEPVVRRKLARARQHLDAFGRPAGDAVFYEFGAGWDLAIPLAYAALGVGKQVLVDIRPSARVELVNENLGAFRRLSDELEQEAGRELRRLPERIDSLSELDGQLGIAYLAPRDARATGLADGSVDFVSSTDTCEHIPEGDLAGIFAECHRLLRPGGAFSCRIDLADHYAYFDRSLSRYNFLRFPDRAWNLVNSPLHFQNRSRAQGLEELRRLPLAPRFRDGYTPEELGVTVLSFVGRA